MSQKALERLEILRNLNSTKEWINHGLYRLMYEEDLYKVAYERIKSKPGNMTAGTDGRTLDGFSLQEIQTIIHLMRTEQFHFKPVKTTFIPKANGKMRKLGIPMVRSYCPPYGKLSGLCCQGGLADPIHPGSTVAYFACVDEHLVVSNDAEPACGARR
jgi:hypothetical protein